MGEQRKLEIVVGISPQTVGVFSQGQATGAISLGRTAAWGLEAPGVQDFHAYLFFDGSELFVAGLFPEQPVWVDSVPLLAGWARLSVGSQLKIGQAQLRYEAADPLEHILPAPHPVSYGPAPPPFSVVAAWPPERAARKQPTNKGGTLLVARPASASPAVARSYQSPELAAPDQGAVAMAKSTLVSGAAAPSAPSTRSSPIAPHLTAQPIPLTRERRGGLERPKESQPPATGGLDETMADLESQRFVSVAPELLLAGENADGGAASPGSGRERVERAWARLPTGLRAMAYLVPVGLTVWSLYLIFRGRG